MSSSPDFTYRFSFDWSAVNKIDELIRALEASASHVEHNLTPAQALQRYRERQASLRKKPLDP